jgi:hypothetical protein
MMQNLVVNSTQTTDRNITKVYSNDVSPSKKLCYISNSTSNHLIFDTINNSFFWDNVTLVKYLSPLFNKVITHLIEKKEHLALQLNYEFGNLTEEEFNSQEERYLKEPEVIEKKTLAKNIQMLFNFTGRAFDAIELSEMFNCEVQSAEESIQLLLFDEDKNA